MGKCIALNCRSGSENNRGTEKIHFFRVPKDSTEEFQKALKRENFTIKRHHYVCHKHFLPSDISWRREVMDPCGNVMASEDYKIPRLKKGRIPTQFLNSPKPLLKTAKESESPKEKKLLDQCKPKQSRAEVPDVQPRNLSPDISAPELYDSSTEESVLSLERTNGRINAELSRINLFESWFSNEKAFKLPELWCRCDINYEKFQALTFMQWTGRIRNNIVSTIATKKVVLYKDLTIHAFVMDIPMEVTKLNFTKEFISCINDVECIINYFHKLNICEGFAISSPVLNLETSFAFRDSAGHLRHHYCTLVLDSNVNFKSKYCLPCKEAEIILSNKKAHVKDEYEL